MCLRSLEEEIMFNAGHLLAEEEHQREVVDQPENPKHFLKKKPGRRFRHAVSDLYIHESGRNGYETNKTSHLPEMLRSTRHQNFLFLFHSLS